MYKASDYIYKAIAESVLVEEGVTLKEGVTLTLDNSEDIYDCPDEFLEGDYLEDKMSDALYEIRYTGEEISLSPKNYSRHYEVDCVVSKFDDVWIAWDYYYGGGKHADPDAIEWISDAEILNLDKEEEVVTVVRTFSRKEK
ncbi:conserved hypothetical protein [Vibrio phage 249E41-1]|nr:conserved hypothetical protein [Vibrio phage 249E41-1]